ncbi:hypothetical protein A1O3_10090 [Capronia epimyces CBS 606.96]|uniref:Nephrocystin 3-like N-terminal domain-containing protein n=1 Tax=Capronia epimyces CBS 606.96 TaxID=1182542 RepID=W9X9Q0_9EURO|nr:uncharacterized protein A1O3_10090 [Capronia epimyces CBS 606.96]EXJ76933.1 hypothetical protein A1O3_10090 [Capronia epimyces CBS 606.96]
MERLKSLVNSALTDDLTTLSKAIHSEILEMREQTVQLYNHTTQIHTFANQETQSRLSRWLNIPDPSINYHAALKKRHPETGRWLVDGQDFADWKCLPFSLMWLHGNAGCGKTVLSAAALHDILQQQKSQPDVMVSYFYFDFNDAEKQLSRKAIRSLLFQFALQDSRALEDLQKLHQDCRNGHQQPPEDRIRSLFWEVLARPRPKYILLDALDECTDREELLIFISDLSDSTPSELRILATSRRERDIEDELHSVANHCIDIQSALVDIDIRVYIRDRMATDKKLKKWPPSVQNEITAALMEKAGGMFRWVFCQLASIRQCIKLSTLRKTLSSLPKTLDETYSRILQGLEGADQLQDAIKVLRWLCFSMRPLLLEEIVEIIAIQDQGEGGFDPQDRLPDPRDVMVVCSSFISLSSPAVKDNRGSESDTDKDVTDEDDTKIQVRLAHFSVKEFLLSDRCSLRPEFEACHCHRAIGEGCLHYLLHLFQNGPLSEEVVHEYPMADYAAEHWWQHTRMIDGVLGKPLLDLAVLFLTGEETSLRPWLQLYDIETSWDGQRFRPWHEPDDLGSPLYYASVAGVTEVVDRMMDQGIDVNAQGGTFSNALYAASIRGNVAVVQLLLAAGADVNARGGRYDSALEVALVNGHEPIVRLLEEAGAVWET